jgi:hypothetical protein
MSQYEIINLELVISGIEGSNPNLYDIEEDLVQVDLIVKYWYSLINYLAALNQLAEGPEQAAKRVR